VSRKSLFSVITFGLLAVATTSCGGGESPKPTESKAPQAAANASPAASPAVAASAPNFSQPLVAAKEKETEQKVEEAAKPTDAVVAGLLPASDSDSIVRSTTKGRTDPFSGVVLNTTTETKTIKATQATPSITKPTKIASSSISTTKTTTIAPKNIPASTTNYSRKIGSGLGIASAAATLAKKNTEPTKIAKVTSTNKPATNTEVNKPATSTVAIKPVNTPGLSTPVAKPNPEVAIRDIPPAIAPEPIPQPSLARAITVSGVSQVNGQIQVIVKLPTESFSRYVSVGERLMDGKVLIKRVQEFSGSSPVVILEEVGVEVPRKIGDKPVVEKDDVKK
jgi:hypothetical protein